MLDRERSCHKLIADDTWCHFGVDNYRLNPFATMVLTNSDPNKVVHAFAASANTG
jgi:hypothetical protein